MKGVHTPQPVKDLIIQRVKNGERVDDIALEFHLYPNTIRKWVSQNNSTTDRDSSSNPTSSQTRAKTSETLLISKLQREKQELLEIIGELTVLTKRSKKN